MSLGITDIDRPPVVDPKQHQAVWDFVASVEDWRCTVCRKRIEYADRAIFDATHLCPGCSNAVNESAGWQEPPA